MKEAIRTKEPTALARWEEMAIEAVGDVIEFWGFKRNQGRVWALLYLGGEALSAGEIERALGLSKGGVSMLIRDLERWSVIRRERTSGDPAWRYRAETELIRMVTRVVEQREGEFITRIRSQISEARRLAAEAVNVSPHRLARRRVRHGAASSRLGRRSSDRPPCRARPTRRRHPRGLPQTKAQYVRVRPRH